MSQIDKGKISTMGSLSFYVEQKYIYIHAAIPLDFDDGLPGVELWFKSNDDNESEGHEKDGEVKLEEAEADDPQ